MQQTTLDLNRNQYESGHSTMTAAGVVAIDHEDDRDIILKFLSNSVVWGEPSRMVRIDLGLAEQLRRLLAEELGDA